MDGLPPAYTPTEPAARTTTKRSIEDTRALILSNAQIIKPRVKIDGSITLVVGKTGPPASTAAQRQQGKHYAALVARGTQQIQQILRGEPQDTIEEALEWLLDRTENVITEMLDRHGKQMTTGCCVSCDKSLEALPPVVYSQLAGWRTTE